MVSRSMLVFFGRKAGPGTSELASCLHALLAGAPDRCRYEKSPPAITVFGLDVLRTVRSDRQNTTGSTVHDVHLMLQQLLNESSTLAVHHEAGTPGFVMTVAKRPLKLQAFAGGERIGNGFPGPAPYPYWKIVF